MPVVLGLSGCRGFFVKPNSDGGTTSSNVAYVANATAQTVAGWGIGTGTLTAVHGLPGSLGYTPTAAVVSRGNGYLWIATGTGIYAYAIGTGGVLNQLGAVTTNPEFAMDVSPDGQWLVGLNALQQTLDVYHIDASTGGLTLVGQPTYSAGGAVLAKAVAFAPDGQYLYAALGTAGTVEFAFNTSSGTAAAVVAINPGTATSDNGVAVNAASSVVYVARSGTNQVLAYGVGANGALTPVAGSPFAAGGAPYGVTIAGSTLYVANRSDGTVGAYAIGSTGALTAVAGSPFASGTLVQSLAVDSTGKYLFALGNGGSPDLTMYSFDATTVGKLDPVTTETPAMGDGSVGLALTH